MRKIKDEDMIGKRFGRLVVLKRDEPRKVNGINFVDFWVCKCDCGNIKTISGNSIRYGKTKSCGCLGKERAIENCRIARETIFTKHNQFGTRLYNIWGKMNSRCNCKSATQYPIMVDVELRFVMSGENSFRFMNGQ